MAVRKALIDQFNDCPGKESRLRVEMILIEIYFKLSFMASANRIAHLLYSLPDGCRPSEHINDGSFAASLVDAVISI